MDLVVRRLFPEPPGPEVIADFRRHVRETGSPETWPMISTERPPDQGDIRMLAQHVSIAPKLRPMGDFAPCPLCRPKGPKWKTDGSLIWCEATAALYCIGPNCSRGEIRRKINIARNILAQTEQEERQIAALAELASAAGSLVRWSEDHMAQAASATSQHRQFASSLKKFRSLVVRQIKQGLPVGVTDEADPAALARGRAFLSGGWNLVADLETAAKALSSLERDAAPDSILWAEGLAASSRVQRLAEAEEAYRLLQRAHERLQSTAAIFSESALKTLSRLARHPDSLAEFRISWTGASATVEHREEFWRGSTAAHPPRHLPTLERANG